MKRENKKIIKNSDSINISNLSLPLSGNLYKKNHQRISYAKFFRLLFLSTTGLIILISIFSGIITLYSNQSRAETVSRDLIIFTLAKNIVLPESVTLETIIRVANSDQLRNQNDFYKNVNDGDYIIVYKDLSIIYDYYHNQIKNVLTRNHK